MLSHGNLLLCVHGASDESVDGSPYHTVYATITNLPNSELLLLLSSLRNAGAKRATFLPPRHRTLAGGARVERDGHADVARGERSFRRPDVRGNVARLHIVTH